jgi:hypothetical protein
VGEQRLFVLYARQPVVEPRAVDGGVVRVEALERLRSEVDGGDEQCARAQEVQEMHKLEAALGDLVDARFKVD